MYKARPKRYENMIYNKCGRSGLKLPAISLGLWHNFGDVDKIDNCRKMIHRAFDLGITHFDLANNYGPPAGSAEANFGRILNEDLKQYRDEIIVSTKAGYFMWDGPYGDGGSKKYIMASLDQSLKRMGIDYVDIFYHHRPDPETPMEETMRTLDLIVRQGKALYIGLSNYGPLEAKRAFKILRDLGTPCLIHQPKYSMLERNVENGLLDTLEQEKIGAIVFSPLAGGLLTNRYLNGIPEDSRASRPDSPFLDTSDVTSVLLNKLMKLRIIANARDQKLSQMALAWILRQPIITSVLVGASRVSQIEECVEAVHNTEFAQEELDSIAEILG
ncbi:L-glyceraldehyde 3-phosphate reductase [Candidatus Epulonipiscium fishelsonii]|uniref:L-glyceraldehyde 3-phosphate reductase n=1 Tax=Candidatus Epulonipiscium fishelsonii TaxID=77094 RepID=A0ACC8XI24_9FIRM|nr:L-glyceraldehyde 3-phosphate reductase [Epulopiscium sp. SCG-D08WGA-EpuloA1]OON90246.1 MAG: L-glyceraldehyde 3-phosphate reductase [Epulopiscium sp. AS2M-Bin002]